MRAHNDNVCLVSLTQIATSCHPEQTRWTMRHQFHHLFDGKHPLVHQFQHGNQGELYHRHSRSSLGTSSLLVFPFMGSMVGTNDCDSAIIQSLSQSRSVVQGLHGRITFDERALGCIVLIGEKEVSNHSLARDIVILAQEFQFLRRCQVSDMQACPRFLGELYRQSTTLQTSLSTSNLRMILHIRVFPILFLVGCHITVDDVGILTMSHHRQVQAMGSLEDFLQGIILIDKHITSTRTHKEFDTWDSILIQLLE